MTGVLTGGALKYHNGTGVRTLVDLDAAPSTDDYVVSYDADADKFYMKADATGGGIAHATSDGTYYASRNGAWSAITSGNYTLGMTLTANTAITLPTSGTLLSTAAIDDTPDNDSTTTTPSANWAYDHAALASSDTVVGHVELATTTETSTGTSASLGVTPDGLSGSVYGQKEIGWFVTASGAATTVADGTQAAVIPASMNGMNLVDLTCSVHALNSAASGSTTVVARRVRGATAVDMTSTGVTVAHNEYTASDETVDTSNDDLATGDKLYIDVNAITSAAHQGLSCTAVFQTP
jgi:hypothetical protein